MASDSHAQDAATALRIVSIPSKQCPEYVSGASFDPDTLRLAAQTHADNQAISGEFTVKPWVVLYLLDVWEKASAAVEHIGPTRHITMVELRDAITEPPAMMTDRWGVRDESPADGMRGLDCG